MSLFMVQYNTFDLVKNFALIFEGKNASKLDDSISSRNVRKNKTFFSMEHKVFFRF